MQKITTLKNRVLENAFFRPAWHSVFLNPYFINRRSLYAAMRSFAEKTGPVANILDVGCGIKPYRNLFSSGHYTGIDIRGGGHTDKAKTADAYYDGIHIPFEDGKFDTVVCTQVLEHAADPDTLVGECSRVLAGGSRILLSMPFIYPEHEKPFDFRRFTRFEHAKIMERNGFIDIRIAQTTGFFGTFGQIFVIFMFEGIHFRASILKLVLSIFIFGPIQIAALFLDALTGKAGPTMDYVVMARKAHIKK